MENKESEFLPSSERARIAVERARQIVKDNNEMVSRIKSEANIADESADYDELMEAQNISYDDSYGFDLYKIKSSNEVKDFIKNIFGVH